MIGETQKLGDDVRALSSGSFVQLSKGLTHYKLSGPLDGKLVVLIHGIAGPFGIWTKVADSLMSHGFRILQYDLYGRGYSDRPDVNHGIDLYLNQLTDLLTVLSIKSPIALVGWSLGGLIAVSYTAKYSKKVDQLILIAPAGVGISRPAMARIVMIPLLGEILMGLLGRSIIIRSLLKGLHSNDLVNDYRALVSEQMQYKGYLRSFLSTLRYCVFEDATEDYRTIGNLDLPVLMISGSEDSFIRQETRNKIGELIPNLEYNEILDTGHIPHFERPDEVCRLLINFITPPATQ